MSRDSKLRLLGASIGIPSGWPNQIDCNLAWRGEDLGDSYVIHLSTAAIEELYLEAKRYMACGMPLSSIDKSTFQLPKLSEVLTKARLELFKVTGLVLFRGFDPIRLGRRENVIAFAGVSSYLAENRGRQAAGKYLGAS